MQDSRSGSLGPQTTGPLSCGPGIGHSFVEVKMDPSVGHGILVVLSVNIKPNTGLSETFEPVLLPRSTHLRQIGLPYSIQHGYAYVLTQKSHLVSQEALR